MLILGRVVAIIPSHFIPCGQTIFVHISLCFTIILWIDIGIYGDEGKQGDVYVCWWSLIVSCVLSRLSINGSNMRGVRFPLQFRPKHSLRCHQIEPINLIVRGLWVITALVLDETNTEYPGQVSRRRGQLYLSRAILLRLSWVWNIQLPLSRVGSRGVKPSSSL